MWGCGIWLCVCMYAANQKYDDDHASAMVDFEFTIICFRNPSLR